MFQLIYLEQVTSTNDYAKELGKNGAEQIAVIAKEQTKGKGRLGRSFSSKKQNGLYLSLLFKSEDPLFVPVIAALSVYQALCKYIENGLSIKWPNDILVNDKKICGILCESFIKNKEIYVVCGMGVNIQNDFEKDVGKIATCISEHSQHVPAIQDLGMAICECFEKLFKQDRTDIIEQYKKHLINLNRKIRILRESEEITGTCIDVSPIGELIYLSSDGTRHAVNSGEVSIRNL